MPDSFVRDYIGQRISFSLVNEAGQWHGVLEEVGDQWVKVTIGKGRATLIPIENIRSMSIDGEGEPARR